MSIEIPFHTNRELIDTLIANNILLCDYKPAYAGESVGLDLYNTSTESIVIPSMTADLPESLDSSTRQALKKRRVKTLIPTGLFFALPRNYMALIKERGSITKTPLIARAGVIDPGYTGEVFVNMINTSKSDWIIEPQSKLPVQIVIVPVATSFKPLIKSEYDALTASSARGEGHIGSSN